MSHKRPQGRARHGREDPHGASGTLVALLDKRGRFLTAEPFFDRGRRVVVERHRDAAPGRLALLRTSRGHAKVLRVLGRPDVAGDVLEALMLHRGLKRTFPPGVERAAREARDAVAAGTDPGAHARRDLRDLVTFTIDPVTAKDFDDAISAEELGAGHWRVWVHIADVSAYVAPGSPVDREAYLRSTSVYVPSKVEPMLPEALSNDACSLLPGHDRLAVTVEMEIRGEQVERVSFHRSLIRSDERLDYERVDRIFAGAEPALEPWAGPLAAARAAAAMLGRRREHEGALVVDSAEPEFAFDHRGHVIEVVTRMQTESHRVIEYLMIAANEQVAKLLSDRKLPALYRVHEAPAAEAVQRLVDQLASLDVPTPPVPERISSQEAVDLVAEISRAVATHVERTGHGRLALTYLVLRALKRAEYSPKSLGHSGLRLEHYCHFTSPIRRYPDLVCHRSLLSAIGAGEDALPRPGALEEAAAWTSSRERDAMTIERDADRVARCFLLERDLFENGFEQEFDGEVTGVIGAGAFVAFGAGYEGMLPVRRLRGEWWELNEQGTMLLGTRAGATIRLGDPVRVRVQRIEAPRGRVDLDPVELGAGADAQ